MLDRPFTAGAIDPSWQADYTNPLRKIGFYFSLAFVFSRFSLMHELIATFFGSDTHLVILLGLPTVFLIVMTGGLRRTLRGRPAYFWIGFAPQLLFAPPFTSSTGGATRL